MAQCIAHWAAGNISFGGGKTTITKLVNISILTLLTERGCGSAKAWLAGSGKSNCEQAEMIRLKKKGVHAVIASFHSSSWLKSLYPHISRTATFYIINYHAATISPAFATKLQQVCLLIPELSEGNDTWDYVRFALCNLTKDLDKAIGELDQREQGLNDKERKLTDQQQALEAKEQDANTREDDLNRRELAVKGKEHQLELHAKLDLIIEKIAPVKDRAHVTL
ncbi:hypothetical protein QBC45DRAFT_435713 [Copromyces sp. CBS 386.78]|nr:hypothetical protein QBC45DRAFT_435713 [Copromyces sp. CBS 386.78]